MPRDGWDKLLTLSNSTLPFQGEGRRAAPDARRGGVTACAPNTVHEERLSPHPAARYTRVDPPPPGEGKLCVTALSEAAPIPPASPHGPANPDRHSPARLLRSVQARHRSRGRQARSGPATARR